MEIISSPTEKKGETEEKLGHKLDAVAKMKKWIFDLKDKNQLLYNVWARIIIFNNAEDI